MAYTTIKTDIEDGIMVLTLNRPDRLNAFNTDMMNDMIAAFDEADNNDAVRAVIVTGEGRGFCAGADLAAGGDTFDYKKRTDRPMTDSGYRRDGGGLVTLRMYDCKKPIIGAINGPAVGIGVTMQLPMDVRIASDQARFGFVFSRRGIVMEACSSWFLPRLVGMDQATRWVYSGRVFDAKEAHDGGLVSEVVPAERLIPRAREIARDMTEASSAVSVALMRQMMWKMQGADHPMEAHKVDSRGIQTQGQAADAKEGVTAFLEKRPAQFSLRPSADMPEWYPFWQDREFE